MFLAVDPGGPMFFGAATDKAKVEPASALHDPESDNDALPALEQEKPAEAEMRIDLSRINRR